MEDAPLLVAVLVGAILLSIAAGALAFHGASQAW